MFRTYLNTMQGSTTYGRASRREFWQTWAVHLLLLLVTLILYPLAPLYWLLSFHPMTTLRVRRLHDIGRSGYWWFLLYLPVIGVIILLVWALMPSEPHENAYGPVPDEEILYRGEDPNYQIYQSGDPWSTSDQGLARH